jgi:hypothetical protein
MANRVCRTASAAKEHFSGQGKEPKLNQPICMRRSLLWAKFAIGEQ